MGESTPLNPKQLRFCQEYIIDLNGTQAAIRAGYSKKTANEQSSQLLAKLHIQERIKSLNTKKVEKLELTADMILREILTLATVDLSEAYDDTGALLPIKKIPPHIRRAIASVEVFEEFEGYGKDRQRIGETKKVKFWDKTKSLELLGKHLKLFTDRIDHGVTETLGQLIEESMQDDKKE